MSKEKETELAKLDANLYLIDGIPDGATSILATASEKLFALYENAKDKGLDEIATVIFKAQEAIDYNIEDLEEFVYDERDKADYWGDKAFQKELEET